MSIPDDILTTLKPAPFTKLREQLRDGDIVLCQGKDAFSRLIRWSTQSDWSHCGLVFRNQALDQVIVIEAVQTIGVRAVALEDFLSRNSSGKTPYPGKILFARHKGLKGEISDPHVMKMAKFAFSHLGDKFAPGEILKIALRIIDARLFGNRKTPRLLIPDDEFMCSEFVAAAYAKAGLPIPWDGLGFVAPSDIAADSDVEPLAQADVAHPPRKYGKGEGRRQSLVLDFGDPPTAKQRRGAAKSRFAMRFDGVLCLQSRR